MKLEAAPRRAVGIKVMVPLLLLGVLTSILVAAITYARVERQLLEQLRSRALQIGDMVSVTTETLTEPYELQRMIGAFSASSDVSLIVVVGGPDALVKASSRAAWIGRPMRSTPEHSVETLRAAVESRRGSVLNHPDSNDFDIVTPLSLSAGSMRATTPQPGAVLIHVDSRAALGKLHSTAVQLAGGMIALLLLLSVATSWQLQRHVVMPLRKIGRAVENRAVGDATALQRVTADDELGHLARCLDEAFLQRERIQEELRASDARRGAMQDAALDCIVVMDQEGRIVEFNRAAETTFGYSRDEVIGELLHEKIMPQAFRSAHSSGLSRYLATGEQKIFHKRLELAGMRASGEEFPVELAVVPIFGGERRFFTAHLRDITDRKRTEAELIAAKEAAEAASRAKSEFLATMSHEIRTPMNAIIGFSDLLVETRLDAQQREFAGLIQGSAANLLTIINDILDFSRVESGKLTLEQRAYDLRAVLGDVIDVLGTRAREKGLELQATVTPGIPSALLGDAGRVRQVLLNLVSNAIKFTPEGSVRVEVTMQQSVSRSGDAGSEIQVSVTDTGIGIAGDRQQLLFERFTQADSSMARRYGGTGLGLAICRSLVELMGGSIGLRSHTGKGSTFWFRIPLHPAATEQPAPSAAPATEPVAERKTQFSHDILLAEDNVVNAKLATHLLGRLGCRVTTAANGAQALAMVQQAPFALVLMDCQMPDMDGFEATRAIRAWESRAARGGTAPRLPIIAITANAMQGDRERCLEAGMDDYITKPVDVAQLERVLDRFLKPVSPREAPALESSVHTAKK